MILVRLFADGETENNLLSGIPIVTGAFAVLVNRLSFLWNDPIDRFRDRQTRRAQRAAEREEEKELLADLTRHLMQERDALGTSKKRQREINAEIERVNRLFAAKKTKHLMERLGIGDDADNR